MIPIQAIRLLPLLTLQAEKAGAARLASGEIVTVHEDVTEDSSYYSKAWHRAHGPKRTVNRRFIRFQADGRETQEITVESFRGNYLLTAVATYLSLPVVRVGKALKPAQLFPQASLVLLHQVRQVAIYARQLAGSQLDFVLVCQGKTYHGSSVSEVKKGWRRKEQAVQHFEQEVFTYAIARQQYGFCHEGISRFCEVNQLDIEGSYTRAQLREVVELKSAENCALFAAELRTVKVAACK